jgi:XTP/dITP diphosphohydrolase
MKIIFASNNHNKLKEIKEISPPWLTIISLQESGINDELIESSGTIEGNAIQKARQVYEKTGIACFADDSGLEVEALGGKPGVDTAHYAGSDRNSFKNMTKLLDELKGIENRNARFVTVIAFKNNLIERTFQGEIKGQIAKELLGKEGFGYDPVFIPENHTITFGQMGQEQKNSISHRSRAVKEFISFLQTQV